MKNPLSAGRSGGGSFLQFIVSLARWMNLSVVAEGVETRAQPERLREVGRGRGRPLLTGAGRRAPAQYSSGRVVRQK